MGAQWDLWEDEVRTHERRALLDHGKKARGGIDWRVAFIWGCGVGLSVVVWVVPITWLWRTMR